MADVVLNIEGLNAHYGARQAVRDVGFSVKAGETFGLIGLNGAGKTTLIKTILGLKEPTSGAISIMGHARDNRLAKQNIAYLPERFDPPWFLSGYEFLSFSLSFYGKTIEKEEIDRVATMLRLDLAALPRRMQTYSKGMRQKLGLMATVLTGCSLMILDEPMSGLDPLARALVKDLFVSARKAGRTIILSSHILADMDELCDRVAVIHDGDLRFLGVPSDLRRNTQEETLERAFLSCIGTLPVAA